MSKRTIYPCHICRQPIIDREAHDGLCDQALLRRGVDIPRRDAIKSYVEAYADMMNETFRCHAWVNAVIPDLKGSFSLSVKL